MRPSQSRHGRCSAVPSIVGNSFALSPSAVRDRFVNDGSPARRGSADTVRPLSAAPQLSRARWCDLWAAGGRGDGSFAKLEAAADEIEHLKVEGYSVDYLSKLREVSHKFPGRIRNPAVSWAAHRSSGSPEMLNAIAKAARYVSRRACLSECVAASHN